MFVYNVLRLVFFYRATLYVSAVFTVARCPSVCPSVTLVYCIHMAEDIVKLLSRPGSPIILVLSPSVDYQFQGNLFSGGAKHTGVGKICDFRLKSRFISETVYEIGPWLLWNVNR